jgi:hypothetical protein
MKALGLLGIDGTQQGAYIYFDCPKCQRKAAIKAYGEKKNLYYCPACKSSGHIIGLVMKTKNLEWKEANEFLSKALNENAKKITEELNIDYELLYHPFIKDKGITEDMCRFLGIGVPKGKTMLAGCVAFTVRDEEGMRVAYYGIRMKDGKTVFHKSFNPELYLYGFSNLDLKKVVYFTTDIFRCVKSFEEEKQCLCNFGLPYLSPVQLDLLLDIDRIVFMVEEPAMKTIAIQLAQYQRGFYKFEH